MMQRTYALVKLSVPTADVEKIRAYVEIMSGGSLTSVRAYLDNQVYHLGAAFGPSAVAVVQSIGMEET